MPSHGTTSSGHCRHRLCRSSGLDGQLLYSRTNTDTETEGPASAEVSENLPDFNLFLCTLFRISYDSETSGFKQLGKTRGWERTQRSDRSTSCLCLNKSVRVFGWSSGLLLWGCDPDRRADWSTRFVCLFSCLSSAIYLRYSALKICFTADGSVMDQKS